MDDLDRLALTAAWETVHDDCIYVPTEHNLTTLQAAKQVLSLFGERDAYDFRNPQSEFIPLADCEMAARRAESSYSTKSYSQEIAPERVGRISICKPGGVPNMEDRDAFLRRISQLEDELERVRHREQDLADFIENDSLGLHWADPDGIVLWANQAELDLLGYTKEEYVGQHMANFHADQEVIADILRRLAEGQTLLNYEARLRAKDGSIKHVLINSNVCWQGETFLHTRCFTRDITARKEVEDAFMTR